MSNSPPHDRCALQASTHSLIPNSIPPPVVSADESGLLKMTLMIPEKLVGGLFGREGSVIRSFEVKTGSIVKSSQRGQSITDFPNSRAFWIFGSQRQVHDAYTLIMEKLIEITNEGKF